MEPTASDRDPEGRHRRRLRREVAPAASRPPAAAAPSRRPTPPEVDLGRRRFFRQFAGELVQTAATVAGAAQALQRARPRRPAASSTRTAGAARLSGAIDDRRARPARPGRADRLPDAVPRGRRRPLHDRPAASCPDALVEVEHRSAAEVAYAIREMVVRGAPAIGQVAAIGLALTADKVRDDAAVRATGDAARRRRTRSSSPRPTAVNLAGRWTG